MGQLGSGEVSEGLQTSFWFWVVVMGGVVVSGSLCCLCCCRQSGVTFTVPPPQHVQKEQLGRVGVTLLAD